MTGPDPLRYKTLHLAYGSGELSAAGLSALISDRDATKTATRAALEGGFQHLDCAERYSNEDVAGEAIQKVFRLGRFDGKTCSLRLSHGIQSSPRAGQARL